MLNNDKIMYYITFDQKKYIMLLVLLPVLPKTIYYVIALQFYANRIAKKIKVDLAPQILRCKSSLILMILINEFETTLFKHLLMVNTLSLEF